MDCSLDCKHGGSSVVVILQTPSWIEVGGWVAGWWFLLINGHTMMKKDAQPELFMTMSKMFSQYLLEHAFDCQTTCGRL